MVWPVESHSLSILFQTFSSILKWSQMAAKDLTIKYIWGNTAFPMMDYWGLEIDRVMNLLCKKEQPYIFYTL